MTAAPGGPPRPRVNGAVSFWQSSLGEPRRRAPLPGATTADVCIVGGGYTGLWTALALAEADPALRIVVCEQEFCGFGASGRNGGWVTAALPGLPRRYARSHGHEAVVGMQQVFNAAVGELGAQLARLGIDAAFAHGGELTVARGRAQERRLRAAAADPLWEVAGHRILTADETRRRVAVAGAVAGAWTPHCARVHPARLARGLADAAERAGVVVHESTPVTELGAGRAVTPFGAVAAPVVIRATEGFTARLPGQRRTWLPMNSSMVVTDPLPASFWDEVGWAQAETLGDLAHVYLYAQRTDDGRIALGGRGVPYFYGSSFHTDGRTHPVTVRTLVDVLHDAFPATRAAGIAHAWSGVLAVPRDWCASVGIERAASGSVAWAGGYTGHGVLSAYVAGRTLADLVLERETPLTALPWVQHVSRRWEPEPLRWLGVRGLYTAYRAADRWEQRTGRPSLLGHVADRIAGR